MTDNLSRARLAAGHVAANIECALQEKKMVAYINDELLYDLQSLAHAIDLLAWWAQESSGADKGSSRELQAHTEENEKLLSWMESLKAENEKLLASVQEEKAERWEAP